MAAKEWFLSSSPFPNTELLGQDCQTSRTTFRTKLNDRLCARLDSTPSGGRDKQSPPQNLYDTSKCERSKWAQQRDCKPFIKLPTGVHPKGRGPLLSEGAAWQAMGPGVRSGSVGVAEPWAQPNDLRSLREGALTPTSGRDPWSGIHTAPPEHKHCPIREATS